MEAIKLRSTAITKINADLKEGIVPGWRIFKQPTDDVNDGASTSQQSVILRKGSSINFGMLFNSAVVIPCRGETGTTG